MPFGRVVCFVFVWNKFTGWWPRSDSDTPKHFAPVRPTIIIICSLHGGRRHGRLSLSPTCCWRELLRAAINISSSRDVRTRNHNRTEPRPTIHRGGCFDSIFYLHHASRGFQNNDLYTSQYNHSTASNNSRNARSCDCSSLLLLCCTPYSLGHRVILRSVPNYYCYYYYYYDTIPRWCMTDNEDCSHERPGCGGGGWEGWWIENGVKSSISNIWLRFVTKLHWNCANSRSAIKHHCRFVIAIADPSNINISAAVKTRNLIYSSIMRK